MPLRRGVGAKCSVLVNFLHSTELVKSVITDVTKAQKIIRPLHFQKGGGGGELEEATCSCASL